MYGAVSLEGGSLITLQEDYHNFQNVAGRMSIHNLFVYAEISGIPQEKAEDIKNRLSQILIKYTCDEN